MYVVFEDRGDCCWATLNHFWAAAEAAGLEGDPTPVEELLLPGVRRSRPGLAASPLRSFMKTPTMSPCV